jgi:hypothetical protein
LKKYIVSVYRGQENNPRSLVGVVEEVGVKGKKAFTNLDELWEMLNPIKRAPTRSDKRKGVAKQKDGYKEN